MRIKIQTYVGGWSIVVSLQIFLKFSRQNSIWGAVDSCWDRRFVLKGYFSWGSQFAKSFAFLNTTINTFCPWILFECVKTRTLWKFHTFDDTSELWELKITSNLAVMKWTYDTLCQQNNPNTSSPPNAVYQNMDSGDKSDFKFKWLNTRSGVEWV